MTDPDDIAEPWVPPRERAVPAMDHTGGYKPSQYRPRIGRVICDRIEAGETVRQVAADPAMPAYCTIFQWRKVNPDFAAMYDAMRARMAQGRIEAADLAARSKVYWRIHKARVDGKRPRDWVSGKKSTYRRDWAQAYCDRIAAGESGMNVSADPAMPSARAIYRWLRRIPEFRQMYVAARQMQRIGLEWQVHKVLDRLSEGLGLGAGEPPGQDAIFDLAEAKARVARLDGRVGRLGPKTWKAVPPPAPWAGAEPPGGGLRPVKASSKTSG